MARNLVTMNSQLDVMKMQVESGLNLLELLRPQVVKTDGKVPEEPPPQLKTRKVFGGERVAPGQELSPDEIAIQAIRQKESYINGGQETPVVVVKPEAIKDAPLHQT